MTDTRTKKIHFIGLRRFASANSITLRSFMAVSLANLFTVKSVYECFACLGDILHWCVWKCNRKIEKTWWDIHFWYITWHFVKGERKGHVCIPLEGYSLSGHFMLLVAAALNKYVAALIYWTKKMNKMNLFGSSMVIHIRRCQFEWLLPRLPSLSTRFLVRSPTDEGHKSQKAFKQKV